MRYFVLREGPGARASLQYRAERNSPVYKFRPGVVVAVKEGKDSLVLEQSVYVKSGDVYETNAEGSPLRAQPERNPKSGKVVQPPASYTKLGAKEPPAPSRRGPQPVEKAASGEGSDTSGVIRRRKKKTSKKKTSFE